MKFIYLKGNYYRSQFYGIDRVAMGVQVELWGHFGFSPLINTKRHLLGE